MQGQFASVARDHVTWTGHPLDFHLQALNGRIHIPGRSAYAALFTEDVPGLDGLAEFDVHVAVREFSHMRKTELEVWRVPSEIERIPARPKLCNHVAEIASHKVR